MSFQVIGLMFYMLYLQFLGCYYHVIPLLDYFFVQILEKLVGSGRTARNAIDANITYSRRKREDYWMKTLRTIHPYGLNDRVGDDFMRDQATERIGSNFPTLKRSFNRVNRRESRIVD